MQLVLVYAIVIAAALYVAYKIYRMIARKDGCSGCTDCPCCGKGNALQMSWALRKEKRRPQCLRQGRLQPDL